MSPKLHKTLKIATIAFAGIGAVVTLLLIALFFKDRLESQGIDEDTKLIAEFYDGTPTSLGLVTRSVETENKQTVIHHRLLKVLGKKQSKDGKRQFVVIGYHELDTEIGAKIENKAIDIAKVAAVSTQDMLLAKPMETNWYGAILILEQKGGNWSHLYDQSGIELGYLTAPEKSIEIPDLSSKTFTFSVKDGNGNLHYYLQTGKEFTEALTLTGQIDDLDACMEHQARIDKPQDAIAPPKASSSEAIGSTPNTDSSGTTVTREEESSEEAIEEESDEEFFCLQATATVKILGSSTHGFRDLEVTVQGTGPSRTPQSKRYVLHYWPQGKRYIYGSSKNPLSDPIVDSQGDLK